jgi:hypothetical protein
MAIKKFETPELRKSALINYTEDAKKDFQIILFGNGEIIMQAKPGKCIFLTRAQAVDLYTFFDSPRVKTRMLDVMRAHLWAAGGICRELIRFIDKTPPRLTETAPLGGGQPAA